MEEILLIMLLSKTLLILKRLLYGHTSKILTPFLAFVNNLSVPQNQLSKISIQYGATGITFDSTSQSLFVIYGGDVWQINPINGMITHFSV